MQLLTFHILFNKNSDGKDHVFIRVLKYCTMTAINVFMVHFLFILNAVTSERI